MRISIQWAFLFVPFLSRAMRAGGGKLKYLMNKHALLAQFFDYRIVSMLLGEWVAFIAIATGVL